MKRILSAFLLIAVSASAQDYTNILEKYNQANPPEKIYVQFDHNWYVPGETIWFKIFISLDGKPYVEASNLVARLSDSSGRLVKKLFLPVIGATANGAIYLPDSLPQANYYFDIITPTSVASFNGSSYHKQIYVSRKVLPQSSMNKSVEFFPEGKMFLDGVLSVMAFRVIDEYGQPVAADGIIRTEDSTLIASIHTLHDGIGRVQFKPQASKKYFAELTINGEKKIFPLPPVQKSGISLKVDDEKGGKVFQLNRAGVLPSELSEINLVADINRHVVYDNMIAFEDYPSIKGHLLTDSLPSGILRFSIFDKSGKLILQRLSFVNNQEYDGGGEITVIKSSAGKRGEQNLSISFPAAEPRSASVVITSDLEGNGYNILSENLLTDDLVDPVNNPSWYFSNDGDAKLALDNLLIISEKTQPGWNEFLNTTAKPLYVPNRYLISVNGRVKDDRKEEWLTGGSLNIYMEAEDSTTKTYEVKVDDNGRFSMDSMYVSGLSKLYYAYTGRNGKQREARIVLEQDSLLERLTSTPFERGRFKTAEVYGITADEINQRISFAKVQEDGIRELERVTVSARAKKPSDIVNEKYTTGVFRSQAKVVLDNINEPIKDKSLMALDYIKNRIPQVEINGGGFVNRKTLSIQSGQKWAVGVFLNEAPTDLLSLRILRAEDIALVKFFDAGFVGVGSSYPGGAIAVYTKDKSETDIKPEKLPFVSFNGYSTLPMFLSPDYGNREVKHNMQDNRTTLYWSGDLVFDNETTTRKISFYNNDAGKPYRVIVNGFDGHGRLIHLEKIIKP